MTVFAERLCGAGVEQRAALLRENAAFIGVPLAYALKDICIATWAGDPARAANAATVLADLAVLAPNVEIDALAAWTRGMVAIIEGVMEESITRLDDAAACFVRLGKSHTAAATQVSKLIALAILGRYDEAVACGMLARNTFLAHGDNLAAGKIEQNLGTIAWRRGRYREAEQFHEAARARFVAAGDAELLVAAENGLANALAAQYCVREATEMYERALSRAQESGLELRKAEIECNLGNLALAQGNYDHALDYLERSRRRYAALDMPHESAQAEQELAQAYLDLNMAGEAAAIFARVTPTFAALGMRAEQARASAYHGQAAVVLERRGQAAALFATARQLFAEEGNMVSVALVTFFEAQLAYQRGAYGEAITAASNAAHVFDQAGSSGQALLAHWLRGEALRSLGHGAEARALLEATLHAAEQHRLLQIVQRCLTSLGLLAAASGDAPRAEALLERAVTMIEALRAPLPSEELRTAFAADKLGPYAALMRLCLHSTPARVADAFSYAERVRARALAEIQGRSVQTLMQPRDAFEAQLVERMTKLREELNWLYSQITGALVSNNSNAPTPHELHSAVQDREDAIVELNRQLQLRGGNVGGEFEPLDLPQLQQKFGRETVMVAYASLDGVLLAFVVTDTTVAVVRELADESQVEELVDQLRFQIESLRRGGQASLAHHDQLLRRVRHYLERLYTLLVAPLEPWLGERRLVVVPHRMLNYVPFHALYDGECSLIERREVCTVPSARVLRRCLDRPQSARRRAVFLGVPDARAPRVRDEIEALAPLFPESVTLLDGAARSEELRRYAPQADVLHLACHGTFRPTNPLFSALHLADGLFTVRDAYALDLRCDLVVLSACETGVSSVAPGDELIGLARGFFAAGTPALLVSLWTVDDASTAVLMSHFYSRLRAGDNPAAALRSAQCALMRHAPHPFFWAPFVLMGRW